MSNTFLLEKRREPVHIRCVVIVTHVKHLKDSEKMELFYFKAKIHFTLTKHEYNIVKNSINKFCSVCTYTILICMCLGQGIFYVCEKSFYTHHFYFHCRPASFVLDGASETKGCFCWITRHTILLRNIILMCGRTAEISLHSGHDRGWYAIYVLYVPRYANRYGIVMVVGETLCRNRAIFKGW